MTQPPSDQNPPVSCYIRTKNEADHIATTVASALQFAREVLVIDSGSTDGTQEKAAAAGATVHVIEWQGNGVQKRRAEDLCAHDWLFDLDADETVTPAAAQEMKTLFASGTPPHKAYWSPLMHVSPLPGARPIGLARRLKLYDRRFARAPDSRLLSNVAPNEGVTIGTLKGRVTHAMFDDATDLMAKMNRRSSRNTKLGKQKSLPMLRLRIVFGLPFYVLKNLVMRQMARGGSYGFATAMMVGIGRWLRDVKMYEAAHGLRNHEEET